MKRDQRGLAPAVEAAIILPAIVLLLGLMVVITRVVLAEQAVSSAAAAAARAVSIERDSRQAYSAADAIVTGALTENNVTCQEQSVAVDAAGLDSPLGAASFVEVSITCRVLLSDVALPGVPGSRTIVVSQRSAVDTYRQR